MLRNQFGHRYGIGLDYFTWRSASGHNLADLRRHIGLRVEARIVDGNLLLERSFRCTQGGLDSVVEILQRRFRSFDVCRHILMKDAIATPSYANKVGASDGRLTRWSALLAVLKRRQNAVT